MSDVRNIGKLGEEKAIAFLRSQNFNILHTNWRYKKLEVDIIAESEGKIVFIEVKTRSSAEYGEPETFVSPKKQRFIVSAANSYLIEKSIDSEARFDVIGILFKKNETIINHLKDAFYPMVK
jgi:putative endonuclease